MPNVVMMSIWRNDEKRDLQNRVNHLLEKVGVSRWVWVVGDSIDDTPYLLDITHWASDKDITVVHHDTGIVGDDPNTRVRRISQTYNAGFDCVRPDDDYWCLHESDLISPKDLIPQFLATGLCPIAGWVMLRSMFYDTWAYSRNGRYFTNHEPRPAEPFEVESFGSVAMWDAEDLRAGLRTESMDFREISRKLKERGRTLWVDPRITIIQPENLWIPYAHAG